MDRRDFLLASGAMALGAGSVRANLVPGGPDRILVLLELAGGNDGLNTVVPTKDDTYFRARPQLAVRSGTHAIGKDLGLHPSMGKLHELFDEGDLAVVPGVGYPKPNRSHFRSMDIWQSARPDLERPIHGWLGLAADQLARAGAEVPAMAVGSSKLPLCLGGKRVVVPALASLRDYQVFRDARAGGRNRGRLSTLADVVKDGRGDDPIDKLLKQTARQAYSGAEQLKKAAEAYRPRVGFPRDPLGRRFELVARALSSPLGTRIVHVRQTGYDTHAGQGRTHGTLLQRWSDAVAAFANEMRARKLWDKTLVFAFSEFGRRLAENRSRGTDHGAAGPVFFAGGAVNGGLHGSMPSLTELDEGDLRFTTDFRSLYATVLEEWLGVKAKPILRGEFRKLRVI